MNDYDKFCKTNELGQKITALAKADDVVKILKFSSNYSKSCKKIDFLFLFSSFRSKMPLFAL